MRGKEQWAKAAGIRAGITPAYAGKSAAVGGSPVGGWDHPRLCGEKSYSRRCDRDRRGSPPPMRGKDAPWFAM